VVLQTDNPAFLYNPSVYTIDYSPVFHLFDPEKEKEKEKDKGNLVKLLIGRNVPAEIRIRKIHDVTIDDDEKIIEELKKFMDLNITCEQSQEMSDSVVRSIKNIEVLEFFKKVTQWGRSMNLYSHNCQHFSRYVEDNV